MTESDRKDIVAAREAAKKFFDLATALEKRHIKIFFNCDSSTGRFDFTANQIVPIDLDKQVN